jgi:hypothetical protein
MAISSVNEIHGLHLIGIFTSTVSTTMKYPRPGSFLETANCGLAYFETEMKAETHISELMYV